MRILLVNTNTYRFLSPPPIGLAYLSAALKPHGHEVHVVDLMFANDPPAALRAALDLKPCGLVGFSVRNLDNQTMLDLKCPLPGIRALVAIVRERGIPTVLGGTAFTSLPGEMLEYMQADYGIAGDGEPGIVKLAEAVASHANCMDAPGLVWRADGTTHRNPAILASYAKAVHPDWGAIDWTRYRRNYCPPAPGVLIKAGCPYQCSYCNSHASMGRKIVLRDPDAIVEDIRILRREHGVTSLFLVDHCFASPLEHSKSVLQALIRARLGIALAASIGPIPGCYDDELFALFRDAGGIFVVLDAESLSPAMLKSYQKPFAVEDVYRCGSIARKHGVQFGMEMLFGGPGETNQTIRESMDGLHRLDFSLFHYNIGVRILPDTALCAIAATEGIVANSSELLFPKFYLSRDMDFKWAKKHLDEVALKYQRRKLRMLPYGIRNLLRRSIWHGL